MTTKENTINIIIADTQYLVVEALKNILPSKYSIKHIVETKYDLQKKLNQDTIHLLILDYALIDFDELIEIKELIKRFPDLKILILTNTINKTELSELNSIGIKNIILKNGNKDEIFSAIEATLKGKKSYSDDILDILLEINEKKENPLEPIQLTYSEIEIVRMIADGHTTKEIASSKHLSFHTVMTHRKNIFRKLGVTNASELVMLAIRNGIIDTLEYHI